MSLAVNLLLFSPYDIRTDEYFATGSRLCATVRQFDAGKLLALARMPLSASTDSKVIVESAAGKWECEPCQSAGAVDLCGKSEVIVPAGKAVEYTVRA